MKYKPYPKYKDSGIEWIGDIPEDWESLRYKFFFYSNMGNTILKEDLIDGGKFPVYSATESCVLFGYVDKANVILKKGDIVIPARGNSIGHIKVVKRESTCTQTTIYSRRINNDIYIKYINYYLIGLRRHLFQFDRTAIPQITVYQVQNNPIIIPPLSEQQAIATFLDTKTAQIDALIKKKQRQIELLKEKRSALITHAVTKGLDPNVKMKDSGIEWIGEIPEGWSIIKLSRCTIKIGSGITPRGGSEIYSEDGIPLIRSQNVLFEGLSLNNAVKISKEIHMQMDNSKVLHNDILLNITGASIGRCCIVDQHGDMNVNQHVCIIRPDKKLESRFLNYCLRSDIGRIQVSTNTTGGNRQGLTFDNIKSFVIPFFDYTLQSRISDYLDDNILNIETLIMHIKYSILKLKEYRSALITAAVTGKIDVRGMN